VGLLKWISWDLKLDLSRIPVKIVKQTGGLDQRFFLDDVGLELFQRGNVGCSV